MTRQTRYFVLGAGGVLLVGLCTGLFAYLNRGAAFAIRAESPAELTFVPAEASIVAYANVREVMLSEFRDRVRRLTPHGIDRDRLEQYLGLSLEEDIDHVVAFLAPGADPGRPRGLALFRGRFDMTRLEAVARRGGATLSEQAGTRIVSIDTGDPGVLAMGFMEPGLVAVGDLTAVQDAADRSTGSADITSNPVMMRLLDHVDNSSNAWAVGRFGDLNALGVVPEEVLARMPPIAAFAVDGRVNGGVSGSLAIEGRDDQAGQNLRDVVRGFMALAQLQTTGRPELQAMIDSLQLGGTGATVTLSFWLPSEALDLIFSTAN
ncbi:MAG: hypothetical protein VYE68_08215 [Acidobacteriota bacterium]|nr:hypothetical protein [Acidobacteriota bacterium]